MWVKLGSKLVQTWPHHMKSKFGPRLPQSWVTPKRPLLGVTQLWVKLGSNLGAGAWLGASTKFDPKFGPSLAQTWVTPKTCLGAALTGVGTNLGQTWTYTKFARTLVQTLSRPDRSWDELGSNLGLYQVCPNFGKTWSRPNGAPLCP